MVWRRPPPPKKKKLPFCTGTRGFKSKSKRIGCLKSALTQDFSTPVYSWGERPRAKCGDSEHFCREHPLVAKLGLINLGSTVGGLEPNRRCATGAFALIQEPGSNPNPTTPNHSKPLQTTNSAERWKIIPGINPSGTRGSTFASETPWLAAGGKN